MGVFLQVLTLLAVLLLVGFQAFQYLKGERVKPIPTQKVERQNYTFTLKGDVNLAETLLRRGFYISYADGRIFVSVPDKGEALKLLSFYGNYTDKIRTEKAVSYAVSKLIEEDIRKVKQHLEKLSSDYGELKNILTARGARLDFSIFGSDVLELQREIFEKTLLYWDKKFEQLLNGYREAVKEPSVDTNQLLRRAASVYGNDLTYRLFKLWLNIKLNKSRLAADLIKYREYGGSR